MQYRKFIILFSLICFFNLLESKAIDDPKLKYILEKFKSYNSNNYTQNVYLHTDKDTYLVGENIWYSAYVFDGVTMENDKNSGILNIELINISNYVTHSQLIKLENGLGYAQLYLKDSIPDGYYLLRAYTSYMRNFTNEYSFNKIIRIYNDSINYRIYHNKLKRIKRRIDNDIKVSFHPNNNKLIGGIENSCKVLVFNLKQNSSKAYLYDNSNTLIIEFEIKNNIGEFSFTPATKEKYYIKIDGVKEKFDLPKIEDANFLIKANIEKNGIDLEIIKSAGFQLRSNLYLVGHNNQRIVFSEIINEDNITKKIRVPEAKLFNGLNKFVLFDGQYEILAQQCIFFEKEQENIEINLKPEKDSVLLSLNTNNRKNNLSISIVGITDTMSYSKVNLKTQLYLLSETISQEQRNDIFSHQKIAFESFANAYSFSIISQHDFWRDLFNEKKPNNKYEFEKNIGISGTILNEKLKYPVANANVSLSVLNGYYDKLYTKSSDKGKFWFQNLDYKDSINVKLVARKDGKKNVFIDIEESDPFEVNFFPSIQSPVLNKYVKPSYVELNKMYAEKKDTTNTTKLYNQADNVIYIDENTHYRNIFDAIKGKVPGLVVNGNDVLIRGRNSIYGSTDPLYLIDGVPTSKEAAASISMNDVERIEIIKGSQSSMYGIRGGNGVIAIYTRKGFNVKRGELTFEMLGYTSQKSFSISKLPTELYTKYNVSKTLFWSPEYPGNGKIKIPSGYKKIRIRIEGILDDSPFTQTKIIEL